MPGHCHVGYCSSMWLCHQGPHARQIRCLNADTGGGLLAGYWGPGREEGPVLVCCPVFLFRPACEISGASAV
jgi:hypothetical protein